jgi:hypothetical protein
VKGRYSHGISGPYPWILGIQIKSLPNISGPKSQGGAGNSNPFSSILVVGSEVNKGDVETKSASSGEGA